MTFLEALTILDAAILECKKRDIDTPEVKNALDLLERSAARIVCDGKGNSHGEGTQRLNRNILPFVDQGATYTVNPDCSGSIKVDCREPANTLRLRHHQSRERDSQHPNRSRHGDNGKPQAAVKVKQGGQTRGVAPLCR